MTESPTGRGYTQGIVAIVSLAGDAAQVNAEFERAAAVKRAADIAKLCTCKGSSFGMDVDRCPVHGVGCA